MDISNELAYQLLSVAQEQYGRNPNLLESEEIENARRIAKRKLHIEQAVLNSAEASRVAVPEASVEDALLRIMQRYSDDPSALQSDLDSVGMDEDLLRKALARELRVEAVLEYVSAGGGNAGSANDNVAETDASLYYHMNIQRFRQPEIRQARHILITVNDESVENKRTSAFKKISAIHQRLQKKPDRFEEQALKHSECPTALEGGLLGNVKKGVLYPELEQELFTLPLGAISGIIESEMGFHVMRCDEIVSEGVVPFQDVKDRLCEHLQDQKRKNRQKAWLKHLMHAQTQMLEEACND